MKLYIVWLRKGVPVISQGEEAVSGEDVIGITESYSWAEDRIKGYGRSGEDEGR